MVIDISLSVSPTLTVWPGDPPVVVEPVARVEDGDVAAVSRLVLGTHTGTHVDPPAHFLPGGATVDELPLDVLVGPAVVADCRGGGPVDAARLEALALPAGTTRLLLKTAGGGAPPTGGEGPTASGGPATTGVLTPDGAAWLVERGVRLVGADTLSIEPATEDYPVHRLLLGAGVIIVEGLDLTPAAPGRYQLVCLPLRIAGGDGAPARAVLLPPEGDAS
ncbi:MAG: cyclase family protein [Actinomycetota bacterium]